MMFEDEICVGLADDHADLSGLTVSGVRIAADAFVDDDVGRRLQDEIAGDGVRDDLVEVATVDGAIELNDTARVFVSEDLAVIVLDEPALAELDFRGFRPSKQHLDVLQGPAKINVAVQGAEVRSRLAEEGERGAAESSLLARNEEKGQSGEERETDHEEERKHTSPPEWTSAR